eukprot:m.8723 g.8723  ORF g.8723 m.8723 type:complete len:67 (+) comp20797_c0_seq2:28-228(+)
MKNLRSKITGECTFSSKEWPLSSFTYDVSLAGIHSFSGLRLLVLSLSSARNRAAIIFDGNSFSSKL